MVYSGPLQLLSGVHRDFANSNQTLYSHLTCFCDALDVSVPINTTSIYGVPDAVPVPVTQRSTLIVPTTTAAVVILLCACLMVAISICFLTQRKRQRLKLIRDEAYTDSMFHMGPKTVPLHATNVMAIDEWEIPASQVRSLSLKQEFHRFT